MLENKSARQWQSSSSVIVRTEAEPLKSNHKHSCRVQTRSAYDTYEHMSIWAEKGLFLLLSFTGFSVLAGEMT